MFMDRIASWKPEIGARSVASVTTLCHPTERRRQEAFRREAFVMAIACLCLMWSAADVARASWVTETIATSAPEGMRWSSIATYGSVMAICYEDNATSSLGYAENLGDGWTVEIVDDDDVIQVGGYCDIAISCEGDFFCLPIVHISYHDWTNGELKYASKIMGTDDWTIETVDSSGTTGRYTSIAVGSDGYARISYYKDTNADGTSAKDLKYAVQTSTGWSTSIVQSSGDCGLYSSLALDADDVAHIGYVRKSGSAMYVQHARRKGRGWTLRTVATVTNVSAWISLAVNAAGEARLVYYDAANTDLYYVEQCGLDGPWCESELVDGSGTGAGAGRFCSIALDSDDCTHISYYDNATTALKYIHWRPCVEFPVAETIEFKGTVGQFTSIAVDGAGIPHIAYVDVSDDQIHHAVAD